MDTRAATSRVALTIAMAIALTGCVTEGGIGSPESPSSADPTASSAPSLACGFADEWVEYAPYTISSLAASGRVFFLGTVRAIEPAAFNTADGEQPRGFGAKPGTVPNPQPNGQIFTPVVVQVEQVLRGQTTPGVARVLIEGGTIGCYTVKVDVAPVVERGGRYIFVLKEALDADGKGRPDLQHVIFAWPVGQDEVVATPEGPMPLTSLSTLVDQATAIPSP